MCTLDVLNSLTAILRESSDSISLDKAPVLNLSKVQQVSSEIAQQQ